MKGKSDKWVSVLCKALAAAGLIYSIYAWITYSGLYRLLADWQIERWGSYDINLTSFGLILVLSVTPLIIMGVYYKVRGISPEAGSLEGRLLRGPHFATAGPDIRGLIVCVALTILGGLVGGGAFWMGINKSKQTVSFEALDLSERRLPRTHHVELTGLAQTGMIIEFSEETSGNKSVTTYLPVTPRDWKGEEPVVFFLRPHVNAILADNRTYSLDPDTPPFEVHLKGVLFRNDLPGPVRSEYQKHGVKLASPYMVLDTDTKADLGIYWIVAVAGGLTAAAMFFTSIVVAIKNRALSNP